MSAAAPTIPGPIPGPILEIENLSVSYASRGGDIPAVTDFSLQIGAGMGVGLVGESGCGKTSVAMAVMRYLGRGGAVTGGSIRFKGQDLLALSGAELRRLRGAGIAMVYQEPAAALNPSLRIGAQLIEGPMAHEGVSRGAAVARALDLLARARLADPERVMAAFPHQLSGGQQQRVIIAMALICAPALLLLDEPTTALDVTVEAEIVALVCQLARESGTAFLYISHDLDLIRGACDRVAVMYAGELIETGAAADVLARPRHPYSMGLLAAAPGGNAVAPLSTPVSIPGQAPDPGAWPAGCRFGPRCGDFAAGICDRPGIRLQAAGASPDGHFVRCRRWAEIGPPDPPALAVAAVSPPAGSELLRIEGLGKRYALAQTGAAALFPGRRARHLTALADIDLAIRRGEIVALVGESGSGKSTLAKAIVGLEPAGRGSIRLDGAELSQVPVARRAPRQRAAMQMVFQSPDEALNPSFSVGSQIARAVRRLSGAKGGREVRARVLRLLDQVRLPPEIAERLPRQLSGGQKQRVALARALAGAPALLLADEPISALDVSVRAAIVALLGEFRRQRGTSILFISHDLAAVRHLADRVVVLFGGRIAEEGGTEQVFGPPHHPYTAALLGARHAIPGAIRRAIPGAAGGETVEAGRTGAGARPGGCPYHTVCRLALGAICETEAPPAREISPGHRIACHLPSGKLPGSVAER